MRQTVSRQIRHAALHLGMAAYLFFFLGYVVPHHACEHTPCDLHTAAQFADQADHHAIHNPDICQLCKTHGQLDLLAFDAAHARIDASPSTFLFELNTSPRSLDVTSLLSRAPPVIA